MVRLLARFLVMGLLTAQVLALTGCGNLASPEGESPEVPLEVPEDGSAPSINVFFHEEEEVKEMDFEEYIAGVVAGEMENDWHEEALAAQAIIARSFTLQQIDEAGGVPDHDAHASTDEQEFQAYNEDNVNEEVESAVEETKGKAAVFDGEFIEGWFHAYAGPRTALADEGLDHEKENPPYIDIVDSPPEVEEIIPEEEALWSAEFAWDEVDNAVAEVNGEGNNPGPVESAEISEEGPSGRATLLKLGEEEVPAPALRMALDSTEMRSTFLDEIEADGDALKMSGEGFGHGVGMCQWGARALAEKGQSAEDIVQYYYKNIDIVNAWE